MSEYLFQQTEVLRQCLNKNIRLLGVHVCLEKPTEFVLGVRLFIEQSRETDQYFKAFSSFILIRFVGSQFEQIC